MEKQRREGPPKKNAPRTITRVGDLRLIRNELSKKGVLRERLGSLGGLKKEKRCF